MFMRAKATPLKPPNTMLPTPRKVVIMITHVVGARHPNIVAGGGGWGVEGEDDNDDDEDDDADDADDSRSQRFGPCI